MEEETAKVPRTRRRAAGARTRRPVEAAQSSSVSFVTHEEIARRAYEIYLSRGGRDGGAEDDWLRAEQELRHGLKPSPT